MMLLWWQKSPSKSKPPKWKVSGSSFNENYPGLSKRLESIEKSAKVRSIGTSSNKNTASSVNAAKLVWSNRVISEPLTKILSNNDALAVKISKYILGYMRDRYYLIRWVV